MAALGCDAGGAAPQVPGGQTPRRVAEDPQPTNNRGVEPLGPPLGSDRQQATQQRRRRSLTPHPRRRQRQHATPASPSQPDTEFAVLLSGGTTQPTTHPTPLYQHTPSPLATPATLAANSGSAPAKSTQQLEQEGQEQDGRVHNPPQPCSQLQPCSTGRPTPNPAEECMAGAEESGQSRQLASAIRPLAPRPSSKQQPQLPGSGAERSPSARLSLRDGSACKPSQQQQQQQQSIGRAASADDDRSPLLGGVVGLGKSLAGAAARLPTMLGRRWQQPSGAQVPPAMTPHTNGSGGSRSLQQRGESGGKEKQQPLRPLGSSRAMRAVAEVSVYG
jgi:hypothetical protein